MKKGTKQATKSFEDALLELETLVENLEQGDLSLEESLTQFERGIALAKGCQESLNAAEQRVQILLEKDREPEEANPEELRNPSQEA